MDCAACGSSCWIYRLGKIIFFIVGGAWIHKSPLIYIVGDWISCRTILVRDKAATKWTT